MTGPAEAASGDIIVRRVPGLDRAERLAVRRDAHVTLSDALLVPDTELVHPPHGGLDDALDALDASPDVVYAEPDRPVRATSNDPFFAAMWDLENLGPVQGYRGTLDADIDAPDAWWRTRGQGVTVAVADTGVFAGHPDLAPQLTGNPGERGGGREHNGLDDDGNGLTDDWRGWDFIAHDNDPADVYGHGTVVAGTIAAVADNRLGIAGVAPQAKLMPLRVLGDDGSGTESAVADAFYYAGRLGVRIVNASLGGLGDSHLVTQAMTDNPGTLYVVAAGNASADDDTQAVWPCTSPAPNVVCVGASDPDDALASFSNYGASTVDLFAPGVDIWSTTINGGYGRWDGTSMAAPHVAGAAALVLAAAPAASTAQLKAALLSSADRVGVLGGLSVTGGRLNANAAVTALAGPPPDGDADAVPDGLDNCPAVANASQADRDADGIGDACDTAPVAAPSASPSATPAPAAPPRGHAAAAVWSVSVRGRLTVRGGAVIVSFAVTGHGTAHLTLSRSGRRVVGWAQAAHAGTNATRLTRRVHGRLLGRGRYTLTVAVGATARQRRLVVH